MAVTIINPLYSFVQFSNSVPDILPVANENDLKFQVTLQGTGGEMDAIMAASITVNIVNNTGTINSDGSMTANTLIAGTTFFMPYRIDATTVLLYWPSGTPDIDTLDLKTCFRLAFKAAASFFVSNTFQLIAVNKFSSTLEYRCDENAYDFNYCAGELVNKARLPLYLSKPQFQDDESIYVKSSGAIKVLSSVTKKEYSGLTDALSADIHEKVKIALSHDDVTISSYYYSGGIRKNGNYEIEWIDTIDDEVGQAKFKAYTTPYNVRNSNCAECD